MNIFKLIFGISIVLVLASGYNAMNYYQVNNQFKTSSVLEVSVEELVEKKTFYKGYTTYINFNNKRYKMIKADNTATEWEEGDNIWVIYLPEKDRVYYYNYPAKSRLIGSLLAFVIFCLSSIYFFKYLK